MQLKKGEIFVSPYIIYWVQMPKSIAENDRVELLKKDIFLISCNFGTEDIVKLKNINNKYGAYFINIDGVIEKDNLDDISVYPAMEKTAKFFESFYPSNTVFHTFMINNRICDIFRSRGLIYIEKNFDDKANAFNTVLNLIKPIFSYDNEIKRSFLRVCLYPEIKYKTEIIYPGVVAKRITCYLKDLSLNGLGLIFSDEKDLNIFKLKDEFQLRIFTDKIILNINRCIVTRKDPENCVIGLTYNINDRQVIKEDSVNYLVKHVYNWVKSIISEFGEIAK